MAGKQPFHRRLADLSRHLPMDGAFPSGTKGEGFDAGAEYAEQRKGFRGNAENAKTKLCMR